MHYEGKRPSGALLINRAPGRALMRRFAKRRRPGQRQDIEIKLAGRILPTVLLRSILRRPILLRSLLGERDDGENKKKAQGNGSSLRRLTDTTTEHRTLPLAPGTKRKWALVNSSRKPYLKFENTSRTK